MATAAETDLIATEPPPFRLLILDDASTDAELEEDALRDAGFKFTGRRATTRDEFVQSLDEFQPDVVIVDYRVPGFNGFEAARLAKGKAEHRPVILVTGVLSDSAAMDVIKVGIDDFVLKEHLGRLPAAVMGALGDSEVARARAHAEAKRDELARILECAKDAVIAQGVDGRITAWNASAAAIFDCNGSEAIGRPLEEVIQGGFSNSLNQVLRSLGPSAEAANIELRYCGKNGVNLDLWASLSGVYEPTGVRKGTSIIVRDITEQKKLQLQLADTRHYAALLEDQVRAGEELRQWMSIFENIAVGVALCDRRTSAISFANRAFCVLHGLTESSSYSASLYEFFAPAEREAVAKMCQLADNIGFADCETNCLRRDGTTFPARVHTTTVKQAGQQFRIHTVTDISTERALEAELQRSQRLEAVGQLTAGVAHDFNNLMQGIVGNAELLDDEIQDRPDAQDYVNTILRITRHGADLVRHMLSFSRQQLLRPQSVDLDKFFDAFRSTLSRTLDPRIRLEVAVEPGVPTVWVDPTHLHTALLNLAINARDAMPSGGHLCIEAMTSGISSAGPNDGTAANRMAVIRVRDTGTGIPPELMERICEPFFTTKGLQGSGLGLSMVYGFAKQSAGDLRITSRLGDGTCMELWLPLSQPSAPVVSGPASIAVSDRTAAA